MHDRLIIFILSSATLTILVYFGYLAMNTNLDQSDRNWLSSHQQNIAMQPEINKEPVSTQSESNYRHTTNNGGLSIPDRKPDGQISGSAKSIAAVVDSNNSQGTRVAAAQNFNSESNSHGTRSSAIREKYTSEDSDVFPDDIGEANADSPLNVNASVDGNMIDFKVADKQGEVRLRQPGVTVIGPAGFSTQSDSLSVSANQLLPDGHYNYEVVADLPQPPPSNSSQMNNGRAAVVSRGQARGVVATGSFYVANGVSVDPNLTENYYDPQVQ